MINITKERFEELKKRGTAFPLIMEFIADQITPANMFFNLDGEYKFLLESATIGGSSGRYTFLGENPVKKIKSRGKDVTIETDHAENIRGNLIDILKENVKIDYLAENTDLPFSGGAIGYMGYDIIRHIEDIPDENKVEIDIPEAFLMFYRIIVAYDHLKKTVSIVYSVDNEDRSGYEDAIKEIEEMHKKLSKIPEVQNLSDQSKSQDVKVEEDEDTKKQFCSIVEKAKEHILNGDIFQIVLSHRFKKHTEQDPFEIYRRLRRKNPSPYLYYIDYGDFQVIGSSPESLVKVQNGIVETHPIAGTRPRGKTKEEDKEIEEELLSDEKEIAEHMMLVDLGRNDIGKVSKKKTVKVERFKEVDHYSHVMHIVSKVTGELDDGKTCFEALKACFPAGTVSGAPKVRAMELIEELEDVKRELYAGSVGYFGFNGDMDVCIAIRTIILKDKTAHIQAGAGIVYDSVPEKEYMEIVNKAKALLEVV